jgi:ribosomal protein L18E
MMKINNKNITVEPLLKNYKKTARLFVARSLRSCTCFLYVTSRTRPRVAVAQSG